MIEPSLVGDTPPSAWRLLRVWLALSFQSFGGGTATLALIRRAAVESEGWVTQAEFGRFWGLVQLAPGINLLALTILIGRRAAGVPGMVLALLGLLLPSVVVTILLTAGYSHVQHVAWVQAALRGIIPAVVGLGLVTVWQIAQPLLSGSRRAGTASLLCSLLVLLGSALIAWRGHLPVLAILIAGGVICAAENWRRTR
ncbi:MAG: chromate transporter [Janthinobacterium lividum]